MTIAFLGCGKLGEALLTGLLRAGHSATDITVTDVEARTTELSARHGVVAVDATEAASADVLVLAVKPQDMATLLAQISPSVDPARNLLVSVAAGLPTAFFAQRLPQGTPVVRVMPNTPALVGEAMSVISGGAHATGRHLDQAQALLSPVGRVLRVPEEQLDAVTALSGSGPAYFFYLIETMVDAGVALGLPVDVATELMVQTIVGSAVLLRDSGKTPAELRTAVSSPGGTTVAAIGVLENSGVRATVLAALSAAANRSRELAAELGR